MIRTRPRPKWQHRHWTRLQARSHFTDKGNPKGKTSNFSMKLADQARFSAVTTRRLIRRSRSARSGRSSVTALPPTNGDKASVPGDVGRTSNMNLVQKSSLQLTVLRMPETQVAAVRDRAVRDCGTTARASERGLEYVTMSYRFARFINDEVLTAVAQPRSSQGGVSQLPLHDDPWGQRGHGVQFRASSSGR